MELSKWKVFIERRSLALARIFRNCEREGLGVCDEIMYNSFTDWWWENSDVSGISIVNFLVPTHLGSTGGLHIPFCFSICKTTQRHGSRYCREPLKEIKDPWLCFMAKLLLCLALLCFCIFSLLRLNLLFGTGGKAYEAKQEVGNMKKRSYVSLGRPCRVLLIFNNTIFQIGNDLSSIPYSWIFHMGIRFFSLLLF